MTAILLDALAPIFAVLGLGYLAGWIREIDNRHVDELNVLVTDFALFGHPNSEYSNKSIAEN